MNPEQLITAIRAQPFQPFTIRMANDRIYHVDHPEFALIAPNGWAVSVVNEQGIFTVLALNSMASIEYQAPASRE